MIERERFVSAWTHLEQRFGAQPGASSYLEYLNSQGMETEDFLASATSLWATSRFFPRPADFLRVESARGWKALLTAARKGRPADVEAFNAMRAAVPDRAWLAMEALGGLDSIRSAKDLVFLHREYLGAYEQQLMDDSAVPRLPAGGPRALALT